MELKVFSGGSGQYLTRGICDYLGTETGKIKWKHFADGERYVEFEEDLRGRDVYLVQSTNPPIDTFWDLCMGLRTAKGASAGRVTAVIPYYGYGRQDRKVAPRSPITAKLAADFIMTAGADRVLVMDLHSGQIQGFFDSNRTKVDQLLARPVFIKYVRDKFAHWISEYLAIICPDAGSVERNRHYAKRMNNSPIVIIDKRRDRANVSKAYNVIGDVKGKRALIIDDMIDTAGTLIGAAYAVKEEGATEIFAICTHPLLSAPALERIGKSPIVMVLVANTISMPPEKQHEKIIQVSFDAHFGEAIKRIHEERSVSSLFE